MPMSKERRDLLLRIFTLVLCGITIAWGLCWFFRGK